MSLDADVRDAAPTSEADTPTRSGPLVGFLVTLIALAALVVAAALGHLWGANSKSAATTLATSSVDAGFARDMSTHHSQAITMAAYARDNTDNSAIKVLAYDIESSQSFQVGQMQGWLDAWRLSRENPSTMAWMAGHAHLQSDGLMPGMSTPSQINRLEASHGKALNILFLQLMIHHHQGGLTMAEYAQQHSTQSYVRDLAQSMINAQSGEIVSMEQLLRSLGGVPLPAPQN